MTEREFRDGSRWVGERVESGYKAVELQVFGNEKETFEVHVGDSVEVDTDEARHTFLAKVAGLYEDNSGGKFFKAKWFYRIEDTILMTTSQVSEHEDPSEVPRPALDAEIGRGVGLDERRIWIADDADNQTYICDFSVNTIWRTVKILQINPGDEVPGDEVAEFWYNQTYSKKFYTFKDLYMRDSRLPLYIDREMSVLDLFAGCGGFSFLAQKSESGSLHVTHAVDHDIDAISTFGVNYKNVMRHCYDAEHFLELCKKMEPLFKEFVDDDNGGKRKRTEMEENLERFKCVKLYDESLRADEHDQDERRRTGHADRKHLYFYGETTSGERIKLRQKVACRDYPNLLGDFLREFCKKNYLPRPGQIDVIIGGPPCQGISGMNVHARRVCALDCVKNGQIKIFFRAVQYFKPAFVLLENVLDIFRKDDGVYVKFAVTQLLALGYQARVGIIGAGDHGAPQVRLRCFVWGAKSGEEVLPPFPKPTFHMPQRMVNALVYENAKDCIVALTEEEAAKAWQLVINEDVLTDLPEVTNFTLCDKMPYELPPSRPIQMWLRRDPPQHEFSRSERAIRAEKKMEETRGGQRHIIRQAMKNRDRKERRRKLAELFKGNVPREFEYETFMEFVNKHGHYPAADETEEEMMQRHGKMIEKAYVQMRNQEGDLRDHRPKICFSPEMYRMEKVPKGPGKSFRDMAGVVTNADGTCCAGHTHAYKDFRNGCAGGGTTRMPPKSLDKTSRIDFHDRHGWRGTELENCPSKAHFTPTGHLLCPRYCITCRKGKSHGKKAHFGRVTWNGILSTVFANANPGKYAIMHPMQDRVLTIRELARCQGFPDYFCFVGNSERGTCTSSYLDKCYQQIGNAVSPPVAAALGRCLLLAGTRMLECDHPIIDVPDRLMNSVLELAYEDQTIASCIRGDREEVEIINLVSDSDSDEDNIG